MVSALHKSFLLWGLWHRKDQTPQLKAVLRVNPPLNLQAAGLKLTPWRRAHATSPEPCSALDFEGNYCLQALHASAEGQQLLTSGSDPDRKVHSNSEWGSSCILYSTPRTSPSCWQQTTPATNQFPRWNIQLQGSVELFLLAEDISRLLPAAFDMFRANLKNFSLGKGQIKM